MARLLSAPPPQATSRRVDERCFFFSTSHHVCTRARASTWRVARSLARARFQKRLLCACWRARSSVCGCRQLPRARKHARERAQAAGIRALARALHRLLFGNVGGSGGDDNARVFGRCFGRDRRATTTTLDGGRGDVGGDGDQKAQNAHAGEQLACSFVDVAAATAAVAATAVDAHAPARLAIIRARARERSDANRLRTVDRSRMRFLFPRFRLDDERRPAMATRRINK